MPRSSKHHIDVTYERDVSEPDRGLADAELRISFVFHPAQPMTAPSYASGGEPPEPAFAEFDGVMREVDGKWIDAPEYAGWASDWLHGEGQYAAVNAANEDRVADYEDVMEWRAEMRADMRREGW